MENSMEVPQKTKNGVAVDPETPLLDIYLDKTIIKKDTCTPMFTEALFTIAQMWKQSKYPPTEEWIKKMWYTYTMEYRSAIKTQSNATCSNMNATRDYHSKWSKSQRKSQIPHDITYMWNLKYDINQLTYKTKTDSQTETRLWLMRRKRLGEEEAGGGKVLKFGISRCKLVNIG